MDPFGRALAIKLADSGTVDHLWMRFVMVMQPIPGKSKNRNVWLRSSPDKPGTPDSMSVAEKLTPDYVMIPVASRPDHTGCVESRTIRAGVSLRGSAGSPRITSKSISSACLPISCIGDFTVVSGMGR